MTNTYQKIQRQIEALQRQAEKLRTQEVSGVVERIKVAIAHYGLTAEQLGFGDGKRPSGNAEKSTTRSSSVDSKAPKYADGQGNAWSGRGPRPGWLRDALSAGRSLEDFASGKQPPKKRTPRHSATTKRTAQQYRDQTGNRWSGFGPRPSWLKDALASGASLEQFATAER